MPHPPTLFLAFTAQLSAQLANNPLSIPDPTPLPGSPLLDHLLFENGSLLPAALLLASASVFLVLKSRGNPGKGALAAVVLVVLALGARLTSRFVTTTRETIAASARALVAAVASADLNGVDAHLAQDATLRAWLYPLAIDKPTILEEIRKTFTSQYPLKEHAILELQTSKDGPEVARVQVKIRAVPREQEFPHLSWWRLDYRKGTDGIWRVRRVEPLAVALVANPAPRD